MSEDLEMTLRSDDTGRADRDRPRRFETHSKPHASIRLPTNRRSSALARDRPTFGRAERALPMKEAALDAA